MPNPGRGQEVLRRRTLAFLQNCWSLNWNKEGSIQSKTKEYIYLRNKNLHMLTSVNLTLQYAIRVWHHEGGALAGIGAGGKRLMRDALSRGCGRHISPIQENWRERVCSVRPCHIYTGMPSKLHINAAFGTPTAQTHHKEHTSHENAQMAK